jgi:hypothetical protein
MFDMLRVAARPCPSFEIIVVGRDFVIFGGLSWYKQRIQVFWVCFSNHYSRYKIDRYKVAFTLDR